MSEKRRLLSSCVSSKRKRKENSDGRRLSGSRRNRKPCWRGSGKSLELQKQRGQRKVEEQRKSLRNLALRPPGRNLRLERTRPVDLYKTKTPLKLLPTVRTKRKPSHRMFRYDDRVRTRTGTLRQILLPASQQGPNRGPLAPRRESKLL